MREDNGGELLAGLAAGVGASWVKAMSEPPLQRLFEGLVPPEASQKELVGADPAGHPDRMPPAVLADRLARLAGRGGLTTSQRVLALKLIHYGFGALLGVGYVRVAERWPALTRGLGAPAGLVIYTATHGSALPAARIQEPPWRLPASAVLWESSSHVVFGVALEVLRRALVSPPAAVLGPTGWDVANHTKV